MVAMHQCSFSPAGGWIVVMESGVLIYRNHTVFKDARALGQEKNSHFAVRPTFYKFMVVSYC